MLSSIPGILLTHGSYYGTLAATRYFGRQGIRVAVADHGPLTAAQQSRFVSDRLQRPADMDFPGLKDWLADFGRRHPGWLLYPCSDDMAWLMARDRDRLELAFRMLQPAFSVIETLLNKQKLYGVCDELDIRTPLTRYPSSLETLVRIANELEGVFLIKPKTQVGLSIKRKATLADGGEDLVGAYTRFQSDFGYVDTVMAHDSSIAWPMIQKYRPLAPTNIVSVAGFRSPDGSFFRAISSRKVLQYPLNIGVGICFESIPADPILVQQVRRLCEHTGYFGAFEVEFIRTEDSHELIDFNPRYYGQMQLEISRGLAIPGLVLSTALGSVEATGNIAEDFRLGNRDVLKLVMTTQWMAGRVTRSERKQWLDFSHPTDTRYVDMVDDAEDPAPRHTDGARRWRHYLRHPRSSVRTLFGSE